MTVVKSLKCVDIDRSLIYDLFYVEEIWVLSGKSIFDKICFELRFWIEISAVFLQDIFIFLS